MNVDLVRSAHHIALAIFFSGVFLIIAGTAQVFLQDAIPETPQRLQTQGITITRDGTGSFGFTSRYPGITIIAFGFFMQFGAGTLLFLLARASFAAREITPSPESPKHSAS